MKKLRTLKLAVAASLLLATAACSSDGSSSGETVSVDVGTDKPIDLKKGKLKVALFINAQTNQYQQEIAAGAKEQAEEYGWDFTMFQADFDLQTQNNQLQQAAVSKQYDAVGVVVVDGTAECKMLTETLPKANVLVTVTSSPLCERNLESGDKAWAPGTLNFNDTANTFDGYKIWLEATAEAFAGKKNILFVAGPENNSGTQAEEKNLEEISAANPDFKIADTIYTDFTTTDTQAKVRTYLQGHPETDAIIEVYSPDLARGVINAVESLKLQDSIVISDFGSAEYVVPYIESGLVQLTMPYYPFNMGKNLMSSIKQAQDGETPDRVRSEQPDGGPFTKEDVITQENLDSYKPQY